MLTYGIPSVATETIGCDLVDTVTGQSMDTRYITPGANAVSVRYIRDLGGGVPSLSASLVGMGLDSKVTLKRVYLPTGYWVYDSAWIAIPPTVQGALHATVSTADLGQESDDYRTVL
ncbi:MAG: hypothetical protein ABR552_10570 [Actinomycetota bacterium]